MKNCKWCLFLCVVMALFVLAGCNDFNNKPNAQRMAELETNVALLTGLVDDLAAQANEPVCFKQWIPGGFPRLKEDGTINRDQFTEQMNPDFYLNGEPAPWLKTRTMKYGQSINFLPPGSFIEFYEAGKGYSLDEISYHFDAVCFDRASR